MVPASSWSQWENGRGERIRTSDLLVPNQLRYQAALRPVPRVVWGFQPFGNPRFYLFLPAAKITGDDLIPL